ncbi:MAG TPA: carboxypeptidase-like regulatory domain-containing protein [Vicinamibacterales bacterium]|nr:carboxypeptidase-like regulatory domain-containing protein [Vicinamibacterales bacterium]
MNVVLALLLLLQATAARPGVVTGQLQTREGMPAAAIRITALPAPPPNIRPSDGQNYYSTVAPASTALSDAQGRYRLANLAPGRYFIIASVFGYPTYYPATTSADGATVITVGADSPVDGVNFTVLLPPGGRVSGRVSTPTATNAQEKAILSGVALGELLETPVGPDGSFTFGHLPKGSYLLSLFPTPPGMPSRVVQVGETDARIDLVRPTLRTISGRIVAPPRVVRRVLIGFSTERSYVTATTNADGSFSAHVQPARHRIELGGLPPGYTLASARVGNQDVTQGVSVGGEDVSDLVITIAEPPH